MLTGGSSDENERAFEVVVRDRGAHSFTKEVTGRSVGTFANDGDVLRLATGPLQPDWFVAVPINLIAVTFLSERRGSLPQKGRF